MTSAPAHIPPMPTTARSTLLFNIGDVLELGVLTLDREKVITGWNRWLEIATGIMETKAMGRELGSVFPEFVGSASERAVTRALNGETVVLSHRFHRAFLRFPTPVGNFDVDCMQQSTRIVPHIDQDGRVAGAVVLIEDVTERVARDAELRQALRLAESANRAKSEFLASMSHELRTPLGAISGYTDLLMEDIFGPLTESQRTQLTRIKRVTGHVLGIVDEILTFARLEAGREEIHLTEFDAVLIAREAAAVVEPSLRAKGLDFRLDLPRGGVQIVSDELKLTQILINLLGNAAKFVDKGHVSLEVRANPGDNTVIFEVCDTGPGISPANIRRVFEPFTQVDASFARRSMGTGLGLPLSRQIAHLLGGEITLKSDLGAGCIFTVALPQRPVELTT